VSTDHCAHCGMLRAIQARGLCPQCYYSLDIERTDYPTRAERSEPLVCDCGTSEHWARVGGVWGGLGAVQCGRCLRPPRASLQRS
jgi:hypothetical protein